MFSEVSNAARDWGGECEGRADRSPFYVLRDGCHIYSGELSELASLRRTAASIVVTASGDAFQRSTLDATQEYLAAAAKPLIEGQVKSACADTLVFAFPPDHPLYPRFRRIAGSGFLPLPRSHLAQFDSALRATGRGELTAREADRLFTHVADMAGRFLPRTRPIDARVATAIRLLGADRGLSLTELAGAVDISYYRLSHLFSGSLGLPLRAYQQWRRVRQVLELYVAQGYSLTRLAAETSFVDLTHLNRVFYRVLGVQAGYVVRSGRVQVVGLAD